MSYLVLRISHQKLKLGDANRLLVDDGSGEEIRGERLEAGMHGQTDRVGDGVLLTEPVDLGEGTAAVGVQLDRASGPVRPHEADQPALDDYDDAARVDRARTQDRGDQVSRVAVEDQQGMVHMLAVVAVIGRAFPLAVGRVVGTGAVEEDPRRGGRGARASAGAGRLMPRRGARRRAERRSCPGVRALASRTVAEDRQLTPSELEEGIGTQGVGIIRILVTTGQLDDALADEGLQTVTGGRRTRASVGERTGEGGADAEIILDLGEPGWTAIRGQASPAERCLQRNSGAGGEHIGRCGSVGQD